MRESPNGTTTKRSHYVGVFDDRNDAELAARDLREKGFKDDQIGYAWRDEQGKPQHEGNKSGELAASGAGTGVVLGGIIGAAAALLIPGIGPVVSGGLLAAALAGGATGAVAGAAAGGIAGALLGLTVRADERYNDASDIVRRRRGFDYETRGGRPTVVGEKKPSDTDVKR